MSPKRNSSGLRKRKIPSYTKPSSERTKRRKPADSAPLQVFPLLDLPAELRNNIYEKVVEVETAYLSKRTRGNLVCLSALSRINRQVRSEFLTTLTLYAPQIIVRVLDFDFTHVVTFLNRLSDAEVKALPNTTAPKTRQIRINLQILHEPPYNVDLLYRRLNRLQHPTKKGTTMDASYKVVHSHDYSQELRYRRAHVASWGRWLALRTGPLDRGRTRRGVVEVLMALFRYGKF